MFTDTLFGARSGLVCKAGKFTVSTTALVYAGAAASLVAGHNLEGRGQNELSSVTGVAVVGLYSSSDQTSTWKAPSPSESSGRTS